jgi:hypothetical protein
MDAILSYLRATKLRRIRSGDNSGTVISRERDDLDVTRWRRFHRR